MKILIVNTSDNNGGASVAARRLMMALNKNGVKAKMLVRDKGTEDISVSKTPNSIFKRWNFLYERLIIFLNNKFNRERLFEVSIASGGQDITSLPEFIESKIIHIHWTNQGMLSVNNLEAIMKSGKHIVWTLHDMWAFTGICHYSDECFRFQSVCGCCPKIDSTKDKDLAYSIQRKKADAYGYTKITFIGCSSWITEMAKRSSIADNHRVIHIPNTINTNTFCPKEKEQIRKKLGIPLDKKIVLFASMKVTDKRKGAVHIVEACRIIKEEYRKDRDIALLVFGKDSEYIKENVDFDVYSLPFLSTEKEISEVYNAADVFVIPSLQENLPNMVMESMACGVPCVGFDVGGIPEMIDHKTNGYVAQYADSSDIAKGILWVIYNSQYSNLSSSARNKVLSCYSESMIARQHIEAYKSVGLRLNTK